MISTMAGRQECNSCNRFFNNNDLQQCEICDQRWKYYVEVYHPETDTRRFNLSHYHPRIMEPKSHCANCLVECFFCEYNICHDHAHILELPWLPLGVPICNECHDFNKNSFHFSQVLSGKFFLHFRSDIPDVVQHVVERVVSGHEPFIHRTPDEVNEMTDEEKAYYFQVKYLLYARRNE